MDDPETTRWQVLISGEITRRIVRNFGVGPGGPERGDRRASPGKCGKSYYGVMSAPMFLSSYKSFLDVW